ncbi:MAG TPA: NDP-sugar synthase [Acidimicrobiales bacterium]|nr:NDP-sugar synthase [Acidimicrobiales bacterium]
MRAVVLVGGEGTRLRPLTLSMPKQMLPIVGVPMLERVLGNLGRHGVDDAVLSLGYLPDAFMEAYPEDMAAGVHLSYAVEPEPLDTAGAVRFAAEHAGVDQTFVVVNGDVLTDLDVAGLVDFHRRHRAEGTIHLHPVEDPSRFGVVPTDEGGRVTAFVEKPAPGHAPTNLINAGTYVLEPSVLDRIPAGRRVSIERETFPAIVADGGLYAMADDTYWIDTGTPEAYVQANLDLLDGRRPGPASPDARLAGPGIWVTGSATLEGTVTGPAFVADGTVVAGGATVTRSVLDAGVVVAAGASVTGSVLMAGARVGAGSTVEGSILGPGAIVGEGCTVSGLSVLGAEVSLPDGAAIDSQRLGADGTRLDR